MVLALEEDAHHRQQEPGRRSRTSSRGSRDIYQARSDKTIFVRATGTVPYGRVVQAMDLAKAAGVERIGIISEKMIEEGGRRRRRPAVERPRGRRRGPDEGPFCLRASPAPRESPARAFAFCGHHEPEHQVDEDAREGRRADRDDHVEDPDEVGSQPSQSAKPPHTPASISVAARAAQRLRCRQASPTQHDPRSVDPE